MNREAPRPIQNMLEDAFARQPVEVDERQLPEERSDLVALVEETEDGGAVVATSPLSALEETVLLVNSDRYKTDTGGFSQSDVPDVLTGLGDTTFRLRGYPASDTEKLLLIVISRYIERQAYRAGVGRLRASFQRLSRIEDERGTRAV